MSKALLMLIASSIIASVAGAADLRAGAERALQTGAEFFRERVVVEGTYLWQYSADLSLREGESKATTTQGWVQPPGTPAVGMAFLAAWQATSKRLYLDAAGETALGLVKGQLRSGGWTYSIDFSPEGRSKAAYRVGGKASARNVSTLDDNTTQSALRFLVRFHEANGFKDAAIGECIEYALKSLLDAQYPNGAWPQGFEQKPDPSRHPIKRASFPEAWPREYPGHGQYWFRYTLNDNSLATTVETLAEVSRVIGSARAGANLNALAQRSREAIRRAGEFLLLAQLPDPQPAWAQQYDFDMHPSWARKFEPPAISGGESQGALRTLMLVYRETGERKFLEPIPRALDYLRRSRLPDGRLARFNELRSNKPLYFTRAYELTYSDADVPTHYSFKVEDKTEAIAREYERVKNLPADELKSGASAGRPKLDDKLVAEVKAILAAQDAQGRWTEEGRLRSQSSGDKTTRIIRSATFIRNVETLSRYLEGTRP